MTSQPMRALSALTLAALAVSGCSIVFGGNDNPRPDDANTVRPAPPQDAISWSSLEWEAVTFEQPPKTSQEQWDQPVAVTAGPGGWVAVGSNGDVMGYEGRIWRSTDSLSWRLVNGDLLRGLELVHVAAMADSYVAIGTDSGDINNPVMSIMYSEDGVRWDQAENLRGAWASRVAAGPRGYAVVVQSSGGSDLLLSPDGQRWDRVAARDVGEDVSVADIAWGGDGWIAAGTAGDSAVVLRSPDGRSWETEPLPGGDPVEGIADVRAYRVVPGRWATLVLGLDRGPECGEDDWCNQYQTAWSWTAATGWARLPTSNWLLGRGHGVDAHAVGDAGFLYLLGDEVRTSPDGWEWTPVKQSSPPDSFASGVVMSGDRLVAVGTPVDADSLTGWIGSARIR